MNTVTEIQLEQCLFERLETTFVRHASLEASLFRYSTGVKAVRLRNRLGNLIVLPYQGQQIWSMEFYGQPLTMRSIFEEPRPTTHFGSTYGGFYLHCGLLSMGSPGPEDNHPVHGELPNAPYQKAFIRAGDDDKGAYLEIGGIYRHSEGFRFDYEAAPVIRLYEDASVVQVRFRVTNLYSRPLKYMYLAHINFKPEDYGRLVYSAPNSADQVEVFRGNPAKQRPELADFMERLANEPAILDVLDPRHVLDPGVEMIYRYLADEDGWAHTLHIQGNGYAGYVKHRPEELDKVVRWIARTGDEDALGMALPATAGAQGYKAEERRGNIRELPSKQSVTFHVETGLLPPDQAKRMEQHIRRILAENQVQ